MKLFKTNKDKTSKPPTKRGNYRYRAGHDGSLYYPWHPKVQIWDESRETWVNIVSYKSARTRSGALWQARAIIREDVRSRRQKAKAGQSEWQEVRK